MARCAGIKRDGGRCEAVVTEEQTYCYHHDPDQADKRRRVATKGGRSKPNRELAAIKKDLLELAEDVLKGNVDRSNAAVAGQLYNTVIRAVGVELKVREQLDLIERIEELESLLASEARDKGDRRYGT